MKKLLTTLLALLALQGAKADDRYLHVWAKNGTHMYFSLNDDPITTFSGNNMTLTTQQTQLIFSIESVESYTYSNNTTGIDEVRPAMRVSSDGEQVVISQAPSPAPISLYDMSGRCIRTIKAPTGEDAVMSLKGLSQGTYVLKAQNATLKLIKK